MLNLLKKTTPWMVASLLVAASVFAQDNTPAQGGSSAPKCPPKPCVKPCPQPTPPTQACPGDPCCPAWPVPVLNAAYNYPARTQTRCPWDINFDLSLLIWQPTQDNMELGISSTLPSTANNFQGKEINMDFDYKAGFKIGMGGYFDYDNWDMNFGYTWFHNSHNGSAKAESTGTILSSRGSAAFFEKRPDFRSATQNWDLNMDITDLDLGRSYYVGTKLTFHPYFGVRAAWIGQSLNTKYVGFHTEELYEITETVKQKSSSWAIGPRTGLDANWNLDYGFRFFGCGEADLLFTNYTRLSHKDTFTGVQGTPGISPNVIVKQSNVSVVSPHLDLQFGFGWGTYIDCNNWYLDFALGYEFQVFFNQNKFRHFNDTRGFASSTMPSGDLYIQGVTLKSKLDF